MSRSQTHLVCGCSHAHKLGASTQAGVVHQSGSRHLRCVMSEVEHRMMKRLDLASIYIRSSTFRRYTQLVSYFFPTCTLLASESFAIARLSLSQLPLSSDYRSRPLICSTVSRVIARWTLRFVVPRCRYGNTRT